MAKRSIDNSKQEITEKDAIIDKMREQLKGMAAAAHAASASAPRDPRRILHKIAHGAFFWCFVEYASDTDDDEPNQVGWQQFESEDAIREYADKASGEPIAIPETSLNPFEAEKLVRNASDMCIVGAIHALSFLSFFLQRKDLRTEIDRVQEEFRRYRVRAGKKNQQPRPFFSFFD